MTPQKSPQQLLDELSSADPAARLSALRAIADDAPTALREGGPALLDRLLALARREAHPLMRRVLTAVLTCSSGPEVTQVLLDEMRRCGDDALSLELGRRLALEPLAHLQQLAVEMFDAEREAVRIAAARALQGVDGLPAAIQLRRDLLLDRDGEWLLYHEAPEAWADELRGPLAERAWRRVDRPVALWEQWDVLDDGARRRLVRWMAQQAPDQLVALFGAVPAAQVTDAVALEALERGRDAGLPSREAWVEIARRFAGRPDLRVRAAVLASGGLDDQVVAIAQRTAEEPVLRAAALRRWVAAAPMEAAPGLEQARKDAQWAVRAAAAEGLSRLGEADDT